jgi:hypothetical protein
MKVRVGILGLPNVGKSSLFNALAQQPIAHVENFPFCTIEPNGPAPIPVPDPYLEKLAEQANSTRAVPATIDWVDVAGLVKGAHRGEGLGNKFLGNLRECDVLCHVVRIFDDQSVARAEGASSDAPHNDINSIHSDLIFADIAHVERRLERTNVCPEERNALEKVLDGMANEELPARSVGLSPEEEKAIRSMGLLSLKPVLYAFNLDEADYVLDRTHIMESIIPEIMAKIEYNVDQTNPWTVVSAKLEGDLSKLNQTEQRDFLQSLGVQDTDSIMKSLSRNILPVMVTELLDMNTVYTGPGVPVERSKTTRAHLFTRGTLTAEGLARRIHGDIEKGFIRAEVVSAPALLHHASFMGAKEAGKVRTEGRDYALQGGDVVCIKWK